MQTNTNTPYTLLTPHGRAQSAAYSAHGAMLADTVDSALEQYREGLAFKCEALIDKEIEELNNLQDDASMDAEFSIFLSELGKRDGQEFKKLLLLYRTERSSLDGNINILLKLIDRLKTILGITNEDGEKEDGE